MKELTKREIRKGCIRDNPISLILFDMLFGLIGIGANVVILYLGIAMIFSNVLIGLVFLALYPIAFVSLLPLVSMLSTPVKIIMAIFFNRYKIVRAKCVDITYAHIETDTGEPSGQRYIFKADDGKIDTIDFGVPKDCLAFLVVSGKEVLAVFDEKSYYTKNYTSSLGNTKIKVDSKRKLISAGRLFLEYLLFCAIVCDAFGVVIKEWVVALGGGLLLIFYLLGCVLFNIHAKASGIIALIYLFVNGILFYYLSYTYNHSTAAYIIGTVYILISLLISVIWINVKSKK